MRLMIVVVVAAGSSMLAARPGAGADADRGAQLAAMCASCHRLDGRDRGIPSIVGLDEARFAGLMAAFKSGGRSIMHTVAASLSDEEVATLARYLATPRGGSEQP